MNKEEKKMVKTAAFFVSIFVDIRDYYSKFEQALLFSMQGNAWYLTKQLVILAQDDVEEEVKKNMLEKLVKYDFPNQFHMEKPAISRSTEFTELVGFQSWIFFKISEISLEEVEKWIRGEASQIRIYLKGI